MGTARNDEVSAARASALRPPSQAKRHVIQALAAVLYNLNFDGVANASIYTGGLKKICVPGLNCYSCPAAIGACPLGALQAALLNTNRGLPFYMVGLILAFGALFGRTICGWACPFGLIQDLLGKIPVRKVAKDRCVQCGCCAKACPTQAIRFSASGIILPKQEIGDER